MALVVVGRLGWANGDRRPVPRPQLDAYGPGGRWGRRSAGDGTGRATHGDHLADALAEAGAGEGDRLVVLVLPRETDDATVRNVAAGVLEAASWAPPPVGFTCPPVDVHLGGPQPPGWDAVDRAMGREVD